MLDWKNIITGIIIGAIIGAVPAYITLTIKIGKLDAQIRYLQDQLAKYERTEQTDGSRKAKVSVDIPINANWIPQGSATGGGYKDGKLELKAELQGGDDFAELFLDLTNVHLPEIEQNPDGSYNLVGAELIALVGSDHDFKGDPKYPNGAQFILKNRNWDNLLGTFLAITDEMMKPTGMKTFLRVPDHKISREAAGMSLKFTIGSKSKANYKGSFSIKSVKITK